MSTTKKMFDDTKPIVAYHGYQFFKIGEVTADVAHEIGVRLAQELYADRFEVIVTTHLDKKHVHNHILLNSTSFVDGNASVIRKKITEKCRKPLINYAWNMVYLSLKILSTIQKSQLSCIKFLYEGHQKRYGYSS